MKNSSGEQLSDLESKNKALESEVKQQLSEIEKLGQLLSEKSDQVTAAGYN